MDSKKIIERAYLEYNDDVVRYLTSRLGSSEEIDDLVQNIYLRLLSYDAPIIWSSVKNLLFTIASNLIKDYWRHHYNRQDVEAHLFYTTETSSNETEQGIVANDLASREKELIARMPEQRRRIYEWRRFGGMSANEIADKLSLSKRTVENHIFLGYKDIRTKMASCC